MSRTSLPFAMLLLVFSSFVCQANAEPKITIWLADSSYEVQVADTPETRARGLMGQEIDDNTGMLFVYPVPRIATFWMKDISVSLSAIWLDENRQVIGHTVMKPCELSPCIRYRAPAAVKYVLEIPFREKQLIENGLTAEFELP